jgi:hypothetical protein
MLLPGSDPKNREPSERAARHLIRIPLPSPLGDRHLSQAGKAVLASIGQDNRRIVGPEDRFDLFNGMTYHLSSARACPWWRRPKRATKTNGPKEGSEFKYLVAHALCLASPTCPPFFTWLDVKGGKGTRGPGEQAVQEGPNHRLQRKEFSGSGESMMRPVAPVRKPPPQHESAQRAVATWRIKVRK